MINEQTFFEEICRNPDDDVVRLVFADWLEENNQPERAQFIRLQIERAQQEGDGDFVGRYLIHGEDFYWTDFVELLYHDLTGWTIPEESVFSRLRAQHLERHPESQYRIYYHRGFPHTFELNPREYLDYQSTIEDISPDHTLILRDSEERSANRGDWGDETIRELAECATLNRCVELDFLHPMNQDSYRTLLASPQLSRLRRVNVCGREAVSVLEAITTSTRGTVQWINCSATEWPEGSERALSRMVNSLGCTSLEYLHCSGNGIGDEGFASLVRSPVINNLRLLDWSGNDLTNEGVGELCKVSPLPPLRYLNLSYQLPMGTSRLDDATVEQMLESKLLSRLHALELLSNRVTDEGIKRIADSKGELQLRSLAIGGGGVDWDTHEEFPSFVTKFGLRAIAQSSAFLHLRHLTILIDEFDDECADWILNGPTFSKLQRFRTQSSDALSGEKFLQLQERFGQRVFIPN